MSGEDERPEDVLGAELWGALDRPDAQLPDTFDAGFRAQLAEEQGRDALGDDLWELLGGSAEELVPAWRRPANRPAVGWRSAVSVALAIAAVFVVVPLIRDATTPAAPQPPPLELALVRDLELAEHLDLLSHPDFEVLVAWDGEAP